MPHEDGQLNDGSDGTVTQYIVPEWVFSLRPLLALVPVAGVLIAFGRDPLGFIQSAINFIIFETFLFPLAVDIYVFGISVIESFIVLFFGSDRAIGVVGTTPGLLDVPFIIVNPLVQLIGFGGFIIISTISSVNAAIAAALVPLGIAGLPVVTFLWLLEISAAAYLAWVGIQAIDALTGGYIDNAIDVLWAMALPFRRMWEAFRE